MTKQQNRSNKPNKNKKNEKVVVSPSKYSAVQKHPKAVVKVFWSCLVLLDCFTLFQIFCPRF